MPSANKLSLVSLFLFNFVLTTSIFLTELTRTYGNSCSVLSKQGATRGYCDNGLIPPCFDSNQCTFFSSIEFSLFLIVDSKGNASLMWSNLLNSANNEHIWWENITRLSHDVFVPLSPFQIPRKVHDQIPVVLTEFELQMQPFFFRVHLSWQDC